MLASRPIRGRELINVREEMRYMFLILISKQALFASTVCDKS